jgi:hypothetical protein
MAQDVTDGAAQDGAMPDLLYPARELNPSDAQKVQIKSMWEAERPTVASLVQEMAFEGKEMASATAQGTLDDGKVQAIASLQGETIAKLLVEKERLKSKIYITVLNPEQRTKADELQKAWHSRLDRFASRIGGRAAPSPTPPPSTVHSVRTVDDCKNLRVAKVLAICPRTTHRMNP